MQALITEVLSGIVNSNFVKLHTLEGSQWLSTLAALAGFTQLSIKEEDQ
jgi:hypothetical protein